MSFLIRLASAAALALLLFWLFRLAMGLRYAKLRREEERRAEEAKGRRLVAEVPTHAGDVVLFLEGTNAFLWGEQELRKGEIEGARLMLNGRVIDTCQWPGATLPAAGWDEEHDGRERWDVLVYRREGRVFEVPCGSLREGVSREAAQRVFTAVAQAVAPVKQR